MKNFWLTPTQSPVDAASLGNEQRAFYRLLLSALTFIPLMLAFNFLGFVLIYGLAVIGILDNADTKLLIVGAISLVTSALHIALRRPLYAKKFPLVAILLILIDGFASAFQILLWQGITIPIIILAASPAIAFAFEKGFPPRAKAGGVSIALLLVSLIILADQFISYERLDPSSLSAMAGAIIYALIVLSMGVLVFINANVPFRTIAGRIIITFAFISTLSTILTLAISALSNIYFDRDRVFRQLRTINELQQIQVINFLSNLTNEISIPLDDDITRQRMQYLLEDKRDTLSYQFNYELVRAEMVKVSEQSTQYDELFLIDSGGRVVISTKRSNEGQVYSGSTFFQRALLGESYAIEPASSGTPITLVVMRPITDGNIFAGVLAGRAPITSIKSIVERRTTIGETLESYLIGTDYFSLTETRLGQNTEVRSEATLGTIGSGIPLGSGLYINYEGQDVLGYYVYIPEIEAALVTEIRQSEVLTNISNLVLSNISTGIFTAIMAFVIVYVTSRSISEPIIELASRATFLAQGNLATRVFVDRKDEIGELATSFNSVASELQALIQTLEQKVTDRTEDLQKQANRLRLAAEVARDSASARDLDELLNRAVELILERFDFYHTGLFLLDTEREYAVLRASPTDAGQKMIENGHRLRVGKVGIVGNVAATGQPRIALDTDKDVTHFNNPLLSLTRSEMALPLKVNEMVIGVLDVQSERPEAFTQDDIAVLQIMADQLALAIQRAQLVNELTSNLQEIEKAYQQFTVSSWTSFTQEIQNGYRFDGTKLVPIGTLSRESIEAINRGKTVVAETSTSISEQKTTVAVPIKLRDQAIGALNLQVASEGITDEALAVMEEIASRLAIALENARLYTETQKRAEQERVASEITSKIGASISIENILRTTVQEIGRLVPDAEVTIRLQEEKES
jgi:GAF domain-containing protein/HAMP domain-containing protein